MEENEKVLEAQQPEENKPSKGAKFLAGLKERFRKFIVNLKRRPMNIAFFVLILSTIVYLCSLGSLSQTVINFSVEWIGLSVFVNTLFCILSLLLFLNSFPKREKKPKIVMLVMLFVFIAAMIAFDIIFYVNISNAYESVTSSKDQLSKFVDPALRTTIVHIVMVGLAALLTATYPLYGRLINMINTRKVIESNEMKGEIDTSEEV